MAPLQERTAAWSVTAGSLPAGAKAPSSRLLVPVETPGSRQRLVALLGTPTLATEVALLGTLLAFVVGSLQAFAAAGAVPLQGTVGAAVLHSLRSTITEISEALPLALVVLLVAEYVLPERFYPAVDIVGGGLIALVGGGLLVRGARPMPLCEPEPERVAAFLPNASLLAVLLAGITCHRVGYGFALIGVFGLGLLAALVVRHLPQSGSVRPGNPGALRFSVLARALVIIAVGAAIGINALAR